MVKWLRRKLYGQSFRDAFITRCIASTRDSKSKEGVLCAEIYQQNNVLQGHDTVSLNHFFHFSEASMYGHP